MCRFFMLFKRKVVVVKMKVGGKKVKISDLVVDDKLVIIYDVIVKLKVSENKFINKKRKVDSFVFS